MRIIAGSAGRMRIQVPAKVTRPTTDFVRQAIFSRLGERVAGAKVLDLFAGSGAMGMEALSRGAATCLFVEQNRKAVEVIRTNLQKCRLGGGQAEVADVHEWVERATETFDLIFCDPPYLTEGGGMDHLARLVEQGAVPRLLAAKGLWVVERATGKGLEAPPGLEALGCREYGRSTVAIFRRA